MHGGVRWPAVTEYTTARTPVVSAVIVAFLTRNRAPNACREAFSMANYEWKELRGGGRRYVRTTGPKKAPAPAPVEPAPEAVAEAEAGREIKIETATAQTRGPGRPTQAAPV